ncbi:MAG: 3-phosphoshikimate 1-carboxyvinyltransferase [Candidatus Dadabacteria bacterium]|nr:MAG: 3-phosphoshikimate 1-carboxyvinyltransferase [Candidatus Dadabacteria bacterium]
MSEFVDIEITPTGFPSDHLEASVPADKSISHRAAMFAGLGRGVQQIPNYPLGDDNQRTLDVMAALGADITQSDRDAGKQSIAISGIAGQPGVTQAMLFCGNSGTTARLSMGFCAGFDGAWTFDGDASLRRRPMARVIDHLVAMGADVRATPKSEAPGFLPLTLLGGPLRPYRMINHRRSAQVKSALLLAALTGRTEVEIVEPVLSRDHTERFLRHCGYPLQMETGDDGETRLRLHADGVRHDNAPELLLPGDPSSAAFWAALAAGVEHPVRIPGVCVNPTRTGFFDALVRMGARIERSPVAETPEPVADLIVSGGLAHGVTVAGNEVVAAIDELPLLALLGMFLPAGECVEIRDAGELRVKETDRIEAVAQVVRAFGGEVETGADWLRVSGHRDVRSAGPVEIDALHDHRIAIGGAIAALIARRPLRVKGGGVADISYPQFWQQLVDSGLADVRAG